jgi:hypothetical protein
MAGNAMIPKGRFDYFAPNEWSFRCDECGLKWKSSRALKRWDNCMVCPLCFELRNPQDLLKGMPDHPAPPWTRPDPPPVFFAGTATTTSLDGDMLLDSYMLGSTMLG